MRQFVTSICLFVILTCHGQDSNTRLFPYPEPPAELETLSDRTSYLVQRFWDKCNLNSAILKRDQFKQAFVDYVSFMPYADAEVVHESIDNLIAKFAKDPERLLTLAEIAEETVYNEDGEFISDEIYLPFAEAVVRNKKISSARKARFAHQVSILNQSQVGMTAPEISFTRPDGSKGNLSEIHGSYILLFFNDPDCDDCRMARVQLSADYNLNQLIDDGYIKVVSIYPGEADADWIESVKDYNPRWIVGAAADVDDHYDMRDPPVIYYLNGQHKILSKTLLAENLLTAFSEVNHKINRDNK